MHAPSEPLGGRKFRTRANREPELTLTNEQTETPPTGRFPDSPDFPTGPAIGEPLPDFALVDQFGNTVDFTEARAGRRSLVAFQRSTLW